MNEEFTLDNILGGADIDALFGDVTSEVIDKSQEDSPGIESKDTTTTEDYNIDTMFGSESVGSGTQESQEGAETKTGSSSSPYVYSSIAQALKEEGTLSAVDDEFISAISTPEEFKDAIEKQIDARFDERQKRIEEALNGGVEPSEIQQYENVISYLNGLSDDSINDESDEGANLRKQLIYLDCINRGYSEDRAKKFVERSLAAKTDLDDAKDALQSNREFYTSKYKELRDSAKAAVEKQRNEAKQQDEKLKKSILEDKELISGLPNIDSRTRQKIYDNISKQSYRDEESGQYLTPIQRYYKEHQSDFIKNVGILFTLTDGFKSLDGLVKGKVQKEIKKGLNELEHVLSGTRRNSDGSIKLIDEARDVNSYFGNGWDLE